MKKALLATAAAVALLAVATTGPARAAFTSIQLENGTVTKLKFTDYENLVDNNHNGIIDSGDQFTGILTVTSIGTIANSNDLSAQLLTKQLTGTFQITVVNNTSLNPLTGGHLDFALNSGDFINLYSNDTHTFNASDAGGTAAATADASTGGLFAAITGPLPASGGTTANPFPTPSGGFFEGVNDTTIFTSENRNFANFTTNNTGYTFTPQFFGALTGEPTIHTYGDPAQLIQDVKSQLFFVSHLFSPASSTDAQLAANFQFRSEDPVYLFATAVPEPSSMFLMAAGALGLGLRLWRKSRKRAVVA